MNSQNPIFRIIPWFKINSDTRKIPKSAYKSQEGIKTPTVVAEGEVEKKKPHGCWGFSFEE
jgi:hypothetical protein